MMYKYYCLLLARFGFLFAKRQKNFEDMDHVPLNINYRRIIRNLEGSEEAAVKLKEELNYTEISVLAVDCKWNWDNITNKIAILQLATGYEYYLFPLHKIGVPDCIKALLTDETIIKVGLDIVQEDCPKLQREYDVDVKSCMDVRFMAKDEGIDPKDLAFLAYELFGITMEKDPDNSVFQWDLDSLPYMQLLYAINDIEITYRVFRRLARLMVLSEFGLLKRWHWGKRKTYAYLIMLLKKRGYLNKVFVYNADRI